MARLKPCPFMACEIWFLQRVEWHEFSFAATSIAEGDPVEAAAFRPPK
jgi:hypothetical protein